MTGCGDAGYIISFGAVTQAILFAEGEKRQAILFAVGAVTQDTGAALPAVDGGRGSEGTRRVHRVCAQQVLSHRAGPACSGRTGLFR